MIMLKDLWQYHTGNVGLYALGGPLLWILDRPIKCFTDHNATVLIIIIIIIIITIITIIIIIKHICIAT